MDVNYSPEVRRQTDALALLERASDLLAVLIGPEWSHGLRAEWSLVPRVSEPPRFQLTLSYEQDSASAVYTGAELGDPRRTKGLLAREWGGVLDQRLDRLRAHNQRLLEELIAEQEVATVGQPD